MLGLDRLDHRWNENRHIKSDGTDASWQFKTYETPTEVEARPKTVQEKEINYRAREKEGRKKDILQVIYQLHKNEPTFQLDGSEGRNSL